MCSGFDTPVLELGMSLRAPLEVDRESARSRRIVSCTPIRSSRKSFTKAASLNGISSLGALFSNGKTTGQESASFLAIRTGGCGPSSSWLSGLGRAVAASSTLESIRGLPRPRTMFRWDYIRRPSLGTVAIMREVQESANRTIQKAYGGCTAKTHGPIS